ncbi:MAG: hypothetical protein ABJN69_02855 [Hellea sp.]
MAALPASSAFQDCVDFIQSIGLMVQWVETLTDCIVPGFAIENGALQICEAQVLYPGDILHEAAHLAVIPARDRPKLSNTSIGERPNFEAEEMMCLAWSYAACLHLNLDPEFVFHGEGYKGGGQYLAENFKQGQYIGVPMLQYVGMALETETGDQAAYPAMIKWLRP